MLVTVGNRVIAQNDVMMQAFYWNVPVDEAGLNGTWWDGLASDATLLKNAGFTGLWLPSPAKGNWGIIDMGYGIYDHYDLGNYYQKGTTETRFGSRAELENLISVMHNTSGGQPYVDLYADIVLNHVYSSDEDQEVNPAVKEYVFDEAFRNGTQYVPYPTNEITWVVPNAQAGSYWIKIKGYDIKNADGFSQGYDVYFEFSDTNVETDFWESEPNNGGGNYDVVSNSGTTVHGRMGTGDDTSDIDEYNITLSSAHDIIIKLVPRQEPTSGTWYWGWADATNGYYPFEIWGPSGNVAPTTLEARTNTGISYVNHTGTDEPNLTWNYSHFHPVDEFDFLTGWDWYGQDAIIPNTKGFGNDFNTYDPVVKQRFQDWGVWLSNEIGFDGYRLDFVRGFQADYAADWINSLPLLNGSQRFIVGEYWGADFRIKDWVNDLAADGADADGFDFPLKSSLTGMCNGDQGYDMRWLNNAGMIRNANTANSLPGTSVVTWLENHDTGKEHDKWVTKDWKMGYAYILTHEGRPCVFYPHYYGVTLVDNHDNSQTVSIPISLRDDINQLMFARRTYMGGTLEVLSDVGNPWPAADAHDVYIARRQGNGTKDGAIVVINNNNNSTKGLWVDSSPAGFSNWAGQTLRNAFTGATTTVYGDGRVWLEAPARGYAVYVLDSDYVAYSPPSAREGNELASELINTIELDYQIFPNPAKNTAKILASIPDNGQLSIELFDINGKKQQHVLETQALTTGAHEINVDLSGMNPGIYFFKFLFNEDVVTKRIVIQN